MIKAAEWVDARGELSAAELTKLDDWLNESAEHRQAYQVVARQFGHNEELDLALSNIREAEASSAFTSSQKHKKLGSDVTTPQSGLFGRLKDYLGGMPVAFASAALLVFSVFLVNNQSGVDATPSVTESLNRAGFESRSRIGERKLLSLKDGSQLFLNANSQVKVVMGEHSRYVELIKGEVYFEVAKDTSRPFIVDAGDVQVNVVGTAFNVDRRVDQVTIDVTEGLVKSQADREIQLMAGQAVTATSAGFNTVEQSRYRLQSDWRDGWIEADNLPLAELVFRLQKYSHIELVLDSSLNQLPVSGRFSLDNPWDTLSIIAPLHELAVQSKGREIHISDK